MVNIPRYPVAIKSSKTAMAREIEEFLDEAKSMLEIDAYHENIVNLQGIAYQMSDQVISLIVYVFYFIFHYLYCYQLQLLF